MNKIFVRVNNEWNTRSSRKYTSMLYQEISVAPLFEFWVVTSVVFITSSF